MGNSPGRVVAEINIDTPYPRGESFRTSTEYNKYCRLINEHLRRLG
jgi:NitT/TauT family transport system ATP-binding protein